MMSLKRIRLLPKGEDWTSYVWLCYLLFFMAVPVLRHAPAWQEALTVAAGFVAAGLYLWSHWLWGTKALIPVAALVLLGCLFAPINQGASSLFVFGATCLGALGNPPKAFGYLAGILAIIGLETWLLRLPMQTWVPSVIFSALIGSVVIQWVHRGKLTSQLLAAHAESEHLAKVAERERIARDLHDLLGHTLSVIVLKSELASRLTATDPARAADEIRDVERISRDALQQVRAAVRGYRSAGFESELKQATEALQAAGIQVETSVVRPPLSPEQETVFALALREAVTNIVRHAHATVCHLTLRQSGAFCELLIADNGAGGALLEGSGLSGMRERVEALGGKLERDGSRGASLRISVPV